MSRLELVDEVVARRAAAGWAVALLVVFGVLAALVHTGVLRLSDDVLLLAAQRPASTQLDVLMTGISLLASVEVTTALVLLMLLGAIRRHETLSIGLLAPLGFLVLASAIEIAGKSLIHQPGPPTSLIRGSRVGFGVSTAYSFPSGHMTRATLVYGLLALRLMRRDRGAWWAWGCVLLVWTIGFSSVYLGNHWPTDVAGGILLGGAALGLSLACAPRGSLGEEMIT